jgi:Tol biopolymer transport system component
LPQLKERAIAGPGRLDSPKWSTDGRYIAFLDDDRKALVVYEVDTGRTSTIGFGEYVTKYSWTPQGKLSYLKYRSDLSGSPFPEVYDLHQVNVDGTDNHVIVKSLYSPIAFNWHPDGQRIIGIFAEAASRDGLGDIYLVDVSTGEREQLISRQKLKVESIDELSLAADGTILAVRGIRHINSRITSVILIYDLEARVARKEIVPRQVFPDLTMGDLSLQLAGNHQWILFEGNVPEGKCFRNALFFLSTEDPALSFCIPTVGDPIKVPSLSPDARHIAFTSLVGPGANYVMLADLTSEYRSQLAPDMVP